jgi:sortase A
VDIRTILRGLGKTCVAAGLLILLFVAYQLWGTGIAEAHSQAALKKQFAEIAPLTTTAPPPTTTAPPVQGTPSPSTTAPASTTALVLPPPPTGSAVAIIKIPKIGVDAAVVEGVGVSDLEKGPGHYPGSPLPGQAGNAAIAGHRTTYGAPFYRLNELKPGDDIIISTRDSPKPWVYQVMFSHTVDPSDVSVLDPTPDNRLTLTTCTPRFSASQRLVVVSRLIGPVDPHPFVAPRVTAVAPISQSTGSGASGASDNPAIGAAGGSAAGGSAAGATASVGTLSGQGTSTAPAIAWGLACAALWALAWGIGHVWRRWTSYALATPVFLLCLYFFFENFARFVPGNM